MVTVIELGFTLDRFLSKPYHLRIKADIKAIQSGETPSPPRELKFTEENFVSAHRTTWNRTKLTKIKAGPGKGRVRPRGTNIVPYARMYSWNQIRPLLQFKTPVLLHGDWLCDPEFSSVTGSVSLGPEDPRSTLGFRLTLVGYRFEARRANFNNKKLRGVLKS